MTESASELGAPEGQARLWQRALVPKSLRTQRRN